LFIRSDRLCYCGEEIKFALRRGEVTAIVLGHGLPGPLPTRRIYIAWKDVDFGRSGTFNLGCIEGGSILELNAEPQARKAPAKLVESLSGDAPSAAATRGTPIAAIGAVTGIAPNANWDWAGSLRSFLDGSNRYRGRRALWVSFQLLAYLFSMPIAATGDTSIFILLAPAGMLFAWPWYCGQSHSFLLRYKDNPVVEALLRREKCTLR